MITRYCSWVGTFGTESAVRKRGGSRNLPYLNAILKVRLILLDFADYLIYYTRKEVTYELLTHEYNYWRRTYESILLP